MRKSIFGLVTWAFFALPYFAHQFGWETVGRIQKHAFIAYNGVMVMDNQHYSWYIVTIAVTGMLQVWYGYLAPTKQQNR